MEFLALLASLPSESDILLSFFKNTRMTKINNKIIYKSTFEGKKILLLNSGIGKVNAAHSVTFLIEHFPVRGIINFGIGGAYRHSGLEHGDIAVALKEVYGDEGAFTQAGWKGLQEIDIPLIMKGKKIYFNEFPLDRSLLERALKCLNPITHHVSPITNIKSGNFVTVSSVSGTQKRAHELEKRFHAVCENMEGAAVAQVCTLYNIPMLEIRGISNIAGVRDKRTWRAERASENCQQAVLNIISSGCI
jgi:futalosine hydrolase